MPALRRKAHNPTYPGVVDTLNQPSYDSVSFAAGAAMTKTVLFQSPIGQGGKTLAQTNMTQAGQLPFPNQLVITSIKVYVANNTLQADLQNLISNVSFTLTIGTKPWFQGPLVLLPAAMGGYITYAAQIGTAAAGDRPYFSTTNGVPDPRASYALTLPITLQAGEGFNVTLNPETAFNFAAADGTTYGVGTTILVVLDGELTRAVS
ncbi:MAG: hypothetical protein ACRD20_02345 [Terriglobales bacterium]